MKYFLLTLLPFIFFLSCEKSNSVTYKVGDIENIEKITRTLETTPTLDKKEVIKYGDKRVFENQGTYYLEMKSGEYVTTTLLKEGKDGTLGSAGVSCTSTACASTSGCTPVSGQLKCSECTVGGKKGDCTKTVTSEQ